MYLEQRLATCEVCSRVLALEYHLGNQVNPVPSDNVVISRFFACPACHHWNPFITLMGARGFRLKLVPGPDPTPQFRPNTLRRLFAFGSAIAAPQAPLRPPRRLPMPLSRHPYEALTRLNELCPFLAAWFVRPSFSPGT